MKNYVLHLENAAGRWDNASPVGNGSAGMMVYGTVAEERVALNEETIWDGGPMDTKVEGYVEKINHIRQLFLEDKEWEADCWARQNMNDCFNRIKSYEYAGELRVKLHADDECAAYSRDISLNDGICTVAYEKDGEKYSREYFASYPAGVMCAKYTGKLDDVTIYLARENLVSAEYKKCCCGNYFFTVKGETAVTHKGFTVNCAVKTDGQASICTGINVKNATYIEVYITIGTQFNAERGKCCAKEKLEAALKRTYDELKAESTADFRSMMERSDIDFTVDEDLDNLSVSDRLERLKADPDARDFGLMSLYWQFGKYLLIGSSRPGTLPANLQGVWADGLTPPWSSDYHTNINLQMNYWHAEEANITECTSALFDYMNDYLLPGGEKVARENYCSRGMVVHHLSDIYGFAAAADGLWGLWPLGGAWLAYHMWEHYLYTNDKEFLKNVAYKYIRECAEFFLDNTFEGNDGYLHTGPSTSPENQYVKMVNGEKKGVNLAISPTMDIEIVGGLLDFYVETEKILGIDPETCAEAEKVRAKLPPLKIGKYGQLMEWRYDYDEIEPGHRHISHAFGLYPSAQITKKTPELYTAIRITLERRLASGGGHTGWSRAWLINLFARLCKGDEAYNNVRALFTKSTFPNLFDAHPPFQIDGNFGGAAGIGEMVMQSHDGDISIIPAVPEFLNGSFTGLKARGDITVSAEWKNGKVTKVVLESGRPDTKVTLAVPGCTSDITFDSKTVVTF